MDHFSRHVSRKRTVVCGKAPLPLSLSRQPIMCCAGAAKPLCRWLAAVGAATRSLQLRCTFRQSTWYPFELPKVQNIEVLLSFPLLFLCDFFPGFIHFFNVKSTIKEVTTFFIDERLRESCAVLRNISMENLYICNVCNRWFFKIRVAKASRGRAGRRALILP